MRFLYLAIFFILLFSGCMVQSGYRYGYNYDVNYYPQPIPVYYVGPINPYPYHYYYGQFVYVYPSHKIKVRKWK